MAAHRVTGRFANCFAVISLAAAFLLFIASPQSHATPPKQEALSGWLHLIWADRAGPGGTEGAPRQVLVTDAGTWVDIRLDDAQARPFGGLRALNKKRVRVHGQWLEASAGKLQFTAESVETGTETQASRQIDDAPSPIAGSRKTANILCRFGDSTSITPKPSAYFEGMMGLVYPGLDHYWQEASFGNANLAGTIVAGWYNLPRERAYYIYDSNGDGQADANLDRLSHDCTAAADADVYFPDFSGINMMFNQNLDSYSWGGSDTISLDGKSKQYSVTWLPPWGYQNQCVLAHEMGHGFGLPHSSGQYGATYDSPWDVMSDNWASSLDDSQYGCVGIHTISYHKDILGWIPSARKLVVNPGMRRTITLDRLAEPASQAGYLMIQIPVNGSPTTFYTVEARRFAGYDSGLPGEAVVIHSVDTTRAREAQVVDADLDGDPGDDGAMWTPGEKFVDAANSISVKVTAAGPGGFTLTVVSGAVKDPVFSDFDADGLSDPVVWRPGTGVWYAASSSSPGTYTNTAWGTAGDTPVAADYDGDGRSDVAVWRPGNGTWYIRPSSNPGTYYAKQWGAPADHALPADFDGDGFADVAVWRSNTGIWYIRPSNSPNSYSSTRWGVAADVAVPADYDGDGKSDIAVWRPGNGTWYTRPSGSPGSYTVFNWGVTADIPVPGDYDGDGKTDVAVWRPGNGTWYIRPSGSPAAYKSTHWGIQTDVPVPGDYDGDGKTDIAVWRPATGTWYIIQSGMPGSYTTIKWGITPDMPVSQITDFLDIVP